VWLIKIDENGDEEWSQTYSNPGEYYIKGRCVTPTDDGGYFLVAHKYEDISVPNDIIKTDANGVEQWRHTVPVSNNSYTGGIWVHQNAQGDYTIAGRYNNKFALITIDASSHSHSTVTWGAGITMIILVMQILCLMEVISSLE